MNNRYAQPRPREDDTTVHDDARTPESRAAVHPALMWLVLAVTLAADAMASIAGAGTLVQAGTGVATMLCGVAIVTRHVSRRR